MIWAAFSYFGKTAMCKMSNRMKYKDYIDLLEEILIYLEENKPTSSWIFQHDNVPIHKAKETMDWFRERNIDILSWPVRFPELNREFMGK